MSKVKKFYETESFRKVATVWSKKLKASGFRDIESKNDARIDNIHKQEFKVDHTYIQYNRLCCAYLVSGKITDKIDQFIFEKHCEGISNHEIADLFNAQSKHKKFTSRAIDLRLTKIIKSAGITPIKFSF